MTRRALLLLAACLMILAGAACGKPHGGAQTAGKSVREPVGQSGSRPVSWADARGAAPDAARAQAREDVPGRLVDVSPRPGVTVRFLYLPGPDKAPVAVMFAGGDGQLHLGQVREGYTGTALGRNFLIRTRQMFLDQGIGVVIVDAPTDRPNGMEASYRFSPAHAADIAAVVDWLRATAAGAPVWLAGTSMGTVSALRGAASLGPSVAGVVISSVILKSTKRMDTYITHPDGARDMDLSGVTAPVLVVSHKGDACPATPPDRVWLLARKLKRCTTLEVRGGLPPEGGPCEALAAHGFYGVEAEAVGAMCAFIKAH